MDMGLSPNSENTKSFHRENWKVNLWNFGKVIRTQDCVRCSCPKASWIMIPSMVFNGNTPGHSHWDQNSNWKNPWARPQALFATPSGPWDLRQSGQAFLVSHPFVPPNKGSPGATLPWQERPTLLRLCCYRAKCCRATWLQSYWTDVLKDMWDYSGTKGIHTIVL